MRRVTCLVVLLAMPLPSTAADVLARMDRVACLSEGLAAAAAMALRLTNDDLDTALQEIGSADQAELVRLAYGQRPQPNAKRQIDLFAAQAVATCHDDLRAQRLRARRFAAKPRLGS